MEKYLFCTCVMNTAEMELIKRRMKFSGLEIHEIEKVTLWNRMKGFFRKLNGHETKLDFIPKYLVYTQCTVDEWKRYLEQWNLVNLGIDLKEEH